jgi:predicted DNA-binding transcriptional regulator AlpA
MKAKSTYSPALNGRRIIRMAQLRQKYPVSESQIFLLIKKGTFPKPFALAPGGRAVGWFEDEIDAYLEKLAFTLEEHGDE